MSNTQLWITIAMLALGTSLTRFLPFLLFPAGKSAPQSIRYLGRVLPAAAIGMLVVYCLKGTDLTGPAHGIPELVASACVIALHLWKRNTLLSILCGTVVYMLLVQLVF